MPVRRAVQKVMVIFLSASLLPAVGGAASDPGRRSRRGSPAPPAPEWAIAAWLNGDPGSLGQQRGRVVLIDFFQLWCPGCNAFSVPLFQRWEKKYAHRADVLVVSIHTVFEGHSYQTEDRLRQYLREKEIHHPVGIDAYAHPGDAIPITMRRYRTGGTPRVVIVGKQGRIRFSHLGRFPTAPVEELIERLLQEEAPGSAGR
ncbi:MAG: TlpA family protein disulfide reductase [Acidobacteriota bacterium]